MRQKIKLACRVKFNYSFQTLYTMSGVASNQDEGLLNIPGLGKNKHRPREFNTILNKAILLSFHTLFQVNVDQVLAIFLMPSLAVPPPFHQNQTLEDCAVPLLLGHQVCPEIHQDQLHLVQATLLL